MARVESWCLELCANSPTNKLVANRLRFGRYDSGMAGRDDHCLFLVGSRKGLERIGRVASQAALAYRDHPAVNHCIIASSGLELACKSPFLVAVCVYSRENVARRRPFLVESMNSHSHTAIQSLGIGF